MSTPEERSKAAAYMRRWRIRNWRAVEAKQETEEYKEMMREYRRSNVVIAIKKRNLSKKRGAEVSNLTAEEWLSILEDHGGACAYCGRTDKKLCMEHVIPISRGGNHTKDNVVPSCHRCNNVKGSRTAKEWSDAIARAVKKEDAMLKELRRLRIQADDRRKNY